MSKKIARDVKYFKMLGESIVGCLLRVLVVDLWHLLRINIFPLTEQSFFSELLIPGRR